MKALTKHQYDHLTHNFGNALLLAKQSMVANGIDELIPIYEEIAGKPMERNCSDCRLDMMITLYIAVMKYEKAEFNKEIPTKKNKNEGKEKQS